MTTEVDRGVRYSSRGIPTYSAALTHGGLNTFKLLQAADSFTLERKIAAQSKQWDEMWEKRETADARTRYRDAWANHLEMQQSVASERTAQAQAVLDQARSLLSSGLDLDPTLDWERMKSVVKFEQSRPSEPPFLNAPEPPQQPNPPEQSRVKYSVSLDLGDWIVPSWRRAKRARAESLFAEDLAEWEATCRTLAAQHEAAVAEHKSRVDEMWRKYERDSESWEEAKKDHDRAEHKRIESVGTFQAGYEAKDPSSVAEYCEEVLGRSEYPEWVPGDLNLEFVPDTGVLIVNRKLPAPTDVPTLSEVKYVKAHDTLTEKHISDAQVAKLYDEAAYQITLRSIHEVFQADYACAVSSVVFNGFVTSIDRATGNEVTACILSVQANRVPFLTINLENVDPKSCFKQLKGVGSSKLHSVTPVAPILDLNRDDRRFVASHSVASSLEQGDNLAVMDWEEFEHLIRELFEKEFSLSGGEVRVTQASRDGGVDAVAFDPDPIRGGKVVIQAKRYANTVPVSAVRDLYGTVMNEGANKGILVTTSDFGPDAYDFANGKPLTLLSGSHLLHLVQKHGGDGHINLAEAKQVARERAYRKPT